MGTPTLVNSKDLADFAATRAATDTPSRHGPSPRCESARFEVEEFTRFIIALDETIRWEDIRPKTVQAPLMDGGPLRCERHLRPPSHRLQYGPAWGVGEYVPGGFLPDAASTLSSG